MYIYMYINICVYITICVYINISIYINVYLWLYIYIYGDICIHAHKISIFSLHIYFYIYTHIIIPMLLFFLFSLHQSLSWSLLMWWLGWLCSFCFFLLLLFSFFDLEGKTWALDRKQSNCQQSLTGMEACTQPLHSFAKMEELNPTLLKDFLAA